MYYYKKSILTFILIWCSYSLNYASEQPLFIQKYTDNLPRLNYDKSDCLSIQDKSKAISDYICKFTPSKKALYIEGNGKLEDKITKLIEYKKPISLILLGFPFKSTNREKKCLSEHVDIGEYLSLATLNTLVQNIKLFHSDTHCTVVSDGLAYHIDDYDAPYEQIFNYHREMNSLCAYFPHVSFISWNINGLFEAYNDLQKRVDLVSVDTHLKNDRLRFQEMTSFVTSEFESTYWQKFFLEKAEKLDNSIIDIKPKLKEQKMKTLKNQLIAEKTKSIVPSLITKGKQFSILVSQIWPHYDECIRLSVHCDKNNIDVSSKIPISLIYGYQGTPWHNAVVIDSVNNGVEGFFKDVFKKKQLLTTQTIKCYDIKTEDDKSLSLEYIAHQH